MKKLLFRQTKTRRFANVILFAASFVFVFFITENLAQVKKQPVEKTAVGKTVAEKLPAAPIINLPKVLQIDEIALKNLLEREGENSKPLLVNFWATWCAPCVEEFPDLVKIGNDYQGKIDFITVSLDDLAEINRDVPAFLGRMKTAMPAYLLKTPDEEAAIKVAADDWQGGLPFTILYDGKGATVYSRQGKFISEVLRREIDNVLKKTAILKKVNLPLNYKEIYSYERGVESAKDDIKKGNISLIRYGLPTMESLKSRLEIEKKYGITAIDKGCVIPEGFSEFARGYNEISLAAIEKKFGKNAARLLALR